MTSCWIFSGLSLAIDGMGIRCSVSIGNVGYDGTRFTLTDNIASLPGELFKIIATAFSASSSECSPTHMGTPLCQAALTVGTVVRHAMFLTDVSLILVGNFRRCGCLRYFKARVFPGFGLTY